MVIMLLGLVLGMKAQTDKKILPQQATSRK